MPNNSDGLSKAKSIKGKIPGNLTPKQLVALAKRKGGPVKYYVLNSGGKLNKMLIDTDGRIKRYHPDGEELFIAFADGPTARFVNYFHAYAYMLRMAEAGGGTPGGTKKP